MTHDLLIGLSSILVIGITAQVIAWKIKTPSILLLLTFGFIAGPITGFLKPDQIFGSLLFPLVSIAVAIILFEGGLSLRFKDIPGLRGLILNLISIGVFVSWVLISLFAIHILGLDFEIAILIGAVLTVTGPTVIIPLLNHVRAKHPIGPILKWEGILIDPVGAVLAVLVFEGIYSGYHYDTDPSIIFGLIKTSVVGTVFGVLGAITLTKTIKKYFIPDHLQNPFTLALVILVYVLCDHFQKESGLLGVTVMGIYLANTADITVRHILEFKETLRTLLIACLFVVLAARINLEQLLTIDLLSALIFLFLVIFVVRPISVFISAIGSGISLKEKVFLSLIAPRGIVAAAVASLFALELNPVFGADSELIVQYVFIVIVGTVIFYSLIATPLASLLNLKEQDSNGVLVVGANKIAVRIAKELKANNIKTLLLDTNPRNVYLAIKEGLNAIHGNFLDGHDERKIDFSGLGMLLAVTPNNEANSLATLHYSNDFGRSNVYQLLPTDVDGSELLNQKSYLHGRFLFNAEANFYEIEDLFDNDAKILTLVLKSEEAFDSLVDKYGGNMIPMFLIQPGGKLEIFTLKDTPKAKPGANLIAIFAEKKDLDIKD